MKRSIAIRLTALAITAALALAGCGGGATGSGTEGKARISVDPTSSMPAILAAEKGMFAKHDVTARTQRFLAVQGVDAVLTGQLDFASALDFAVLSRLGTGRLRIIAATATPDPGFNKLIVAKGIDDPADLAGKTMGTVGGTVQQYITSRYLSENGVDVDSVDIQNFTDFSEVVAALRTGSIKAGWVRATDVAETQKGGNTKLLTDESSVRPMVTIFLLARTDFIEDHPETVENVLKALDEGSRYVNEHPDEAAEIVASETMGDAETLSQIIPETHFGLSLTKEQVEGLADIQRYAVEEGLLEPGEDVRSYVESGPLERVLPDRVSL